MDTCFESMLPLPARHISLSPMPLTFLCKSPECSMPVHITFAPEEFSYMLRSQSSLSCHGDSDDTLVAEEGQASTRFQLPSAHLCCPCPFTFECCFHLQAIKVIMHLCRNNSGFPSLEAPTSPATPSKSLPKHILRSQSSGSGPVDSDGSLSPQRTR